MNKKPLLIFFGLALILLALSGRFRPDDSSLGNSESEDHQGHTGMKQVLASSSSQDPGATQAGQTNQQTEDPDAVAFAQKIAGSRLLENTVMNLLKSSLSPNKKAIVLETYLEQGGRFTSTTWAPLLLQLIIGSDKWLELANKAGIALSLVNRSGLSDSEILQLLSQMSEEDDVKRCALASSLYSREAIETALTDAQSEDELRVLSEKHAEVLEQEERLEKFRSLDKSLLKVLYLERYLVKSESRRELSEGFRIGMGDAAIETSDKINLLLAVGESSIPEKSLILFRYWKSLLINRKKYQEFISILNVAIQKSAYSENSAAPAQEIMAWLVSQGPYDSRIIDDPRIDLSIALVNACDDPLNEKQLCHLLADARHKLRNKLMQDGLSAFVKSE